MCRVISTGTGRGHPEEAAGQAEQGPRAFLHLGSASVLGSLGNLHNVAEPQFSNTA